jgi:hypothetical protein
VEPDGTVRFSKVSATFAADAGPAFKATSGQPGSPIERNLRRIKPVPTRRNIEESNERE